jgi:hypothetical protein
MHMINMKGRHKIRANTSSGREPRLIEPWTLEPKENTTLAKLEAAYLSALESVDQIEARKATAQKSGTLTPSGVLADTLGFAASTLAPKLQKAKRAVEQAKHEAAARRAKLVLKTADKADAAGQMRRLWKLDKFNALSDDERNAYLAKAGDNLDPELQQAFLEAPEYSKILPTDLEAIRMRALKQQHGEEAITELADLEAGIKTADDTIAAAREEVALEVGGIAKFDEAAKPYEMLQSAPWLKKFTTNGVDEVRAFTVRDGRGYWNPASAEELENGVYFRTAEEWRMAQSGIVPQHVKEQLNGG